MTGLRVARSIARARCEVACRVLNVRSLRRARLPARSRVQDDVRWSNDSTWIPSGRQEAVAERKRQDEKHDRDTNPSSPGHSPAQYAPGDPCRAMLSLAPASSRPSRRHVAALKYWSRPGSTPRTTEPRAPDRSAKSSAALAQALQGRSRRCGARIRSAAARRASEPRSGRSRRRVCPSDCAGEARRAAAPGCQRTRYQNGARCGVTPPPRYRDVSGARAARRRSPRRPLSAATLLHRRPNNADDASDVKCDARSWRTGLWLGSAIRF